MGKLRKNGYSNLIIFICARWLCHTVLYAVLSGDPVRVISYSSNVKLSTQDILYMGLYFLNIYLLSTNIYWC